MNRDSGKFSKTASAFLVGLVIAAVLGELGYNNIPALHGWKYQGAIWQAPQGDSYPTNYEHRVFYHGLGETLKNAAAAKVLFLGNSRVGFAFDEEFLTSLKEETGLGGYLMGFGDEEGAAFPLELLQRHNLQPDFIVVNVDDFFSEELSETAKRMVKETKWDAIKGSWEDAASFEGRRKLHQVVPRFMLTRKAEVWTLYRSERTGAYQLVQIPNYRVPIAARPVHTPITAQEVATAEAVVSKLQKHCKQVVLTYIPHPHMDPQRAAEYAAALELPLLTPSTPPLISCDGSHLHPDSGKVFGRAFLEEFKTLIRP